MKTSTIWIVFSLIILSGGILNAQEFKFGFLGGFVIANPHVTDKPVIAKDSRVYYPLITFSANGFVEFKSTGFFGFSIEPGFIQKGGVLKYDKNIEDDNVSLKLNYIQIPCLAEFYLIDKFFLSIGPELAYMMNAKAISREGSNDIKRFLYK